MRLTKGLTLILCVAGLCLYWVPAVPFPDTTKQIVNSIFFILSVMTSFVLIPDTWDIIRTGGRGMSWQAMIAKLGLFTLTTSFAAARIWALIVAWNGYPDEYLHGPMGGFFSYTMGLGLGAIFLGFSSVKDMRPSVTFRGALVLSLFVGVVIGLVIAKSPI